MSHNTKKILILSIIGLIALRFLSLFLVPYLPHLEQYKHNKYFSAINEGDDWDYYYMAEMIYKMDFKEDFAMMGFPVMIVPFIFIFGNDFWEIFLPVVIFNSVFLFSLCIILIVWLSFLIFRKIFLSVFSGFLFVAFPFVFYVFRDYGPQFATGAWNDTNFMHMNWLSVMADQPATFFALLILFLIIISVKKEFGLVFYSLLGFLAGYSAMIRITNIVVFGAAALIILLCVKKKKYLKLFFYGLFSILGFLPQFLYNFYFFGSPLSFGYQKEYYTDWYAAGSASGPMWDFGNFFHLFSRAVDYSLLAIPAFLAIFTLLLFGFLRVWKINRCFALAVSLFFLFPTLIYMFFETGQTAMRYYMVAVPAFLILNAGAMDMIYTKLRRIFCLEERPRITV